jgi:hypothetical protein
VAAGSNQQPGQAWSRPASGGESHDRAALVIPAGH